MGTNENLQRSLNGLKFQGNAMSEKMKVKWEVSHRD